MRKAAFIIIVSVILFGVGYVYWSYYRVYGSGFREGYFQKFSRKGNVFKTYEGELILEGFGTRGRNRNNTFTANYFYFSVVDEMIADSLEKCIGKVVRLHYTQYQKTLPWRGDNYDARNQDPGQYIVDRIDLVKDPD